MKKTMFPLALAICSVLLPGCSSGDVKYEYPERQNRRYNQAGQEGKNEGKIFGDNLSYLFDPEKIVEPDQEYSEQTVAATSLAVNPYLWQASIEILSFMPLSSTDPVSGVIITDWYAMKEKPLERFKVNVFIKSREFNANSLKVTVFKQEKTGPNSDWFAVEAPEKIRIGIENNIFSKAKELRNASR